MRTLAHAGVFGSELSPTDACPAGSARWFQVILSCPSAAVILWQGGYDLGLMSPDFSASASINVSKVPFLPFLQGEVKVGGVVLLLQAGGLPPFTDPIAEKYLMHSASSAFTLSISLSRLRRAVLFLAPSSLATHSFWRVFCHRLHPSILMPPLASAFPGST